MKDLPDIALPAEAGALDASNLVRAMRETFAHQATHPVPLRLADPPAGPGGEVRWSRVLDGSSRPLVDVAPDGSVVLAERVDEPGPRWRLNPPAPGRRSLGSRWRLGSSCWGDGGIVVLTPEGTERTHIAMEQGWTPGRAIAWHGRICRTETRGDAARVRRVAAP